MKVSASLPRSLFSKAGFSLRAAAALLLGLPIASVSAATFTWNTTTGSWGTNGNWLGGTAPTGTNPADVLVFGGNVSPSYTATNNIGAIPFKLNQLILQATDPGLTGADNFLAGNALVLTGTAPQILNNGTGNFTVNAPIQLTGTTVFGGSSSNTVTLNGAVTGVADIVKNGLGTFRFGTPFTSPATGPSGNTWYGTLTVNAGTFRFNNNAQSAPTALRSNPVVLMSPTAKLTFSSKVTDQESSARMGTLSGTGGTVEARGVDDGNGNKDSLDIGIYAFTNGDYSGTIRNTKIGTQSTLGGSNPGHQLGVLIVRGTGTQTLSGILEIEKDVVVGGSVTLKLAGTATLKAQTTGSIVMQGGTFVMDNSVASIETGTRLRDGNSGSTGVDVIGGGTFSLVGHAAGTYETVSRLQLGSGSSARSGALTVNVTHNAGAGSNTTLNFQSYARDSGSSPANTVNFTAKNGAGAVLALGLGGNNPAVTFLTTPTGGTPFTVPTFNGLLGNTGGAASSATVGWATVNGTDFATYGGNGIAAVAIDATPAASGPGSPGSNVRVTGSMALTDVGGYSLSSLNLAPSAGGQSLTLSAVGNLTTSAILLAGSTNFTIGSAGAGGISGVGGVTGTGPRYFHVQEAALTVDASVGVSTNSPIVKAGEGTLILTHVSNSLAGAPLYINAGAVRATPLTSLPSGEVRFRGGVLEITGGGTFSRSIGFGTGNLTWSGMTAGNVNIKEERGSGGFAAVGADVTVDLNGAGASNLVWEATGFIDSGFALILGSRNATNRITFADNINLTQATPVVTLPDLPPALNYNAREFRVMDNTAVSTDSARISGVISGNVQTDLLKTGSGALELTGANTYGGNTLIHEGILSISAANNLGDASGQNVVAIDGGTLRSTAAGVVLPAVRSVAVGANGATLDVEASAALTVAGSVVGASAVVTKTGAGTLNLNGDQKYGTLTTSGGTTNIAGAFTPGTATVNANAATNFSTNQTLAALNVGAGAVVTFGPTPPPFAFGAVVPEPSSAALAALGAALLGLRRRRA